MQQVPDTGKHQALREILSISEEEASKLESLSRKETASAGRAGGADEPFF